MRCKQKKEMKNISKTKTKKGVTMTKGECSVCGCKMCRMGEC